MQAYEIVECIVEGEVMKLHPYAGMFWESESKLFITDTHFGKISHFRKAGLAVPMAAIEKNWKRLLDLIEIFQPKEIIFLGDLFHSDYNSEWKSFETLVDSFHDLKMTLVLGNHDILKYKHYKNAGLKIVETLEIGPFVFSHEPLDMPELFNFYGHIHPAVVMKGKGKQSMKLACFYFGKKEGILPAFGAFTGTATISVKKDDLVYVIAGNKLIKASF